MESLSRLRRWANRDDGRLYRIGNGPIRLSSLIGVLLLVGALLLSQVQFLPVITSTGTIVAGVVGLVLLVVGLWPGTSDNG